MISPYISDDIKHLISDFSERWVCEAMKVAVVQGKRKLSYVGGILKRWKADGIDEPWEKEVAPPLTQQPSKKTSYSPRGSSKPKLPVYKDEAQPVTDEEYEEILRRIRERASEGAVR